ncbi:hypothetical protein D3C75_648210 [compost metagenome]
MRLDLPRGSLIKPAQQQLLIHKRQCFRQGNMLLPLLLNLGAEFSQRLIQLVIIDGFKQITGGI